MGLFRVKGIWEGGRLLKRIAEKIEMIPFTTCWIWNASITKTGYPQVYYQGQMRKAHRVISHIENGTPLVGSKNSFINHKCNNPFCVNPAHLYEGTRSENEIDKAIAGNVCNPFGRQRLSVADVKQIKKLLAQGEKQIVIAKRYGVSRTTIGKIKSGDNWSWL